MRTHDPKLNLVGLLARACLAMLVEIVALRGFGSRKGGTRISAGDGQVGLASVLLPPLDKLGANFSQREQCHPTGTFNF